MIKVKGYRILVKPDEIEKVTESGIIISQNEVIEESGIQQGYLIAVGEQAWKAFRQLDENGKEVEGKSWAKPGDYVLWARHAGRKVFDPHEPDESNYYMVMNDEDIIAIITEGTNPEFSPNTITETL